MSSHREQFIWQRTAFVSCEVLRDYQKISQGGTVWSY